MDSALFHSAVLSIPAARAPFPTAACRFLRPTASRCGSVSVSAASASAAAATTGNEDHTVGTFMTRKENLCVVKSTTTIDRALEMLVEYRISGFPVIDDNWNLVGVVSDYDLLALDSVSGNGRHGTGFFPEVDSNWNTFFQLQKLLSKTKGKLIGDVMTPLPLVVRESSNLQDVARILLETKYGRLPVVDASGKLIGMITRGNIVKAAFEVKREKEKKVSTEEVF